MNRKILIIANYKPGTGGISGQVEKLHNCLDAENIKNEIFSVKGSVMYRLKAFSKLKKTGKDYDVFHIHTCSNGGFLSAVMGVKIGRKLGKRIIVTYHGGGAEKFFAKHTRLVRKYLTRTDANIVLSGFLGGVFDKYGLPYVTIPNIIELDSTSFKHREELKPNFISVRSLEPLYNIDCTINAFAEVKRRFPSATLTIVGGGSQRERLENLVAEKQIPDISFTGRVDNSQIYSLLDKADIMLSSPRIDNMPVSLLEAFNAGLLVISSNVGGVPYMIEDGKNGLLFESDNPGQLAEKMSYAIDNQQLSKDMILAANRSLSFYTWENVKENLFVLYGSNS